MSASRDFKSLGYYVWTELFSASECNALLERAHRLADAHPVTAKKPVFLSDELSRHDDAYFLGSDSTIRCFFEPSGDGISASNVCNKIGHALHHLDPVFRRFAQHPLWQEPIRTIGYPNPVIVQSMVIFKSARIGGEVDWHQDSCFLATRPNPIVGFWVALEDANLDNGCLWVVPKGHVNGVRRRYIRDANHRLFFQGPGLDNSDLISAIPLSVPKGSVIALHGDLPHRSLANHSSTSRCALTLHVMDSQSDFLKDNWMRAPRKLNLGPP